MKQVPGIDLDFGAGLIVIDGHKFPAAVATFVDATCHRGTPEDPRCVGCQPFNSCVLGGSYHKGDVGWDRSWQVFVPMENGCLANVDAEGENNGGLTVRLYAPVVLRATGRNSDGAQLHSMMVVGREIVPWRIPAGPFEWERVEADWLAEHLQRLSTFTVRLPKGGRTKLVSITDIRVRPQGSVLA